MSELHKKMLENYRAAVSSDPDLYSAMWSHNHYKSFEDLITDEKIWPDFLNNGVGAQMGSPITEAVGRPAEALEVTSAEEKEKYTARRSDLRRMFGADKVDALLDGETGNPFYVLSEGQKLSYHDLRLTYNALRLAEVMRAAAPAAPESADDAPVEAPVFVEIGAGYGGMGRKLSDLFPKARFIYIDLPETNAIQTWFLSRTAPGAALFLKTDLDAHGIESFFKGSARFAVLPPSAAALIPERSVDVFINARSLTEMNTPVSYNYIRLIQKQLRCGGLFYCCNRPYGINGAETVLLKDFPFDDDWSPVIMEPLWDQPHVLEMLLLRTRYPAAESVQDRIARTRPPYTPAGAAALLGEALRQVWIMLAGEMEGAGGNPGLARRLRGLSHNPADPLVRLRAWAGVLKRSILKK